MHLSPRISRAPRKIPPPSYKWRSARTSSSSSYLAASSHPCLSSPRFRLQHKDAPTPAHYLTGLGCLMTWRDPGVCLSVPSLSHPPLPSVFFCCYTDGLVKVVGCLFLEFTCAIAGREKLAKSLISERQR